MTETLVPWVVVYLRGNTWIPDEDLIFHTKEEALEAARAQKTYYCNHSDRNVALDLGRWGVARLADIEEIDEPKPGEGAPKESDMIQD